MSLEIKVRNQNTLSVLLKEVLTFFFLISNKNAP